uniref:G_PROTEIN_RECEP_F1_2 domain-containing protein n=1 Tax=Ascaris lumbricoides TaxID=6252 RepID=A0A0M3ILZ6_ASCLU
MQMVTAEILTELLTCRVLRINCAGITRQADRFTLVPVVSECAHTETQRHCTLYAALFLIGLCGNVSVITLIRHVHATIPYDNTMIFILFLCCVDLASVIPLPMAIVDQLLGFWMFGTICCKVYRTLEHVGRALSTFVLAAMAFDRFRRVWYPHRKARWNTFVSILFLFFYCLQNYICLRHFIVSKICEIY